MSAGGAQIDEMRRRLRELARMPETSGPDLGDAMQAELVRTASAGTTPTGVPWKPKKDGGRPLANAAAAISTVAHGTVIVATLSGPTVFHHYGDSKDPKRQVLPEGGGMPPTLAAAFRQSLIKSFRRVARGGR
jgi:hypothetical protein